MRFRTADRGGLGRAVDAVAVLLEVDPRAADRIVRPGREKEDLVLTNWDAEALGKMVVPGETIVEFTSD